MNVKKILSLLICFLIAAPSLSGAVLPSAVTKACSSAGITEYYLLLSNAAFNMVNAVVENIIGSVASETSKKEAPAKSKEQRQEDNKAVISNNFQKNLQTDFSADPSFTSSGGYFQTLFEQSETNGLFQGWFLLLLAALLMCVRKKDANFAPVQFKYFSK